MKKSFPATATCTVINIEALINNWILYNIHVIHKEEVNNNSDVSVGSYSVVVALFPLRLCLFDPSNPVLKSELIFYAYLKPPVSVKNTIERNSLQVLSVFLFLPCLKGSITQYCAKF